MTPISLLSTASDVFSVSRSCLSATRAGSFPGVIPGVRARCEMQAQMHASAQTQTQAQTRVQMQVRSLLGGLLCRTCTLQFIVQVPAPCRVSSCRNGNKDPKHRARRAPRPSPPCGISVAIISAKSDTTVKPHAIYHNARRVARLPSCRSPWLLGYAGDQGRHSDVKSTAQQMRSFDVILQPANEPRPI